MLYYGFLLPQYCSTASLNQRLGCCLCVSFKRKAAPSLARASARSLPTVPACALTCWIDTLLAGWTSKSLIQRRMRFQMSEWQTRPPVADRHPFSSHLHNQPSTPRAARHCHSLVLLSMERQARLQSAITRQSTLSEF